MSYNIGPNRIAGPGAILVGSGAPANGTSEIQTLTIGGTPTGGTFTITFDGYTTSAITWSSTNSTLVANIDAALEDLPNIGTGGITTAVGSMTSGVGTITLTFAGVNGRKAQNLMVATSSLTGTNPTAAITESTPGVDATFRGAPKGALYLDADNANLYVNAGTGTAPDWKLFTRAE